MTCEKWNIGSAKSIINNGGMLDNEVNVDGKIFQRYWIANR
jgi:predicted acetyltransferase